MKNIPLYAVRPISSLKDMLITSASLYGERTAFLSKPSGGGGYAPITYNSFKKDVDAFGTVLLELGLKGCRIALIGENRYEWVTSYMATVNGTGIIVPLDRELPENEIESLLNRSKASAVIFSGSANDKILGILSKLPSIRFFIGMDAENDSGKILSYKNLLKRGHELINSGNTDFINAEVDIWGMGILLFTSGTTELSKAVMLSHQNISSNLMAMCSMLNIVVDDIFLSILPIHHTYECTCGFLCPIYRGAAVAFCEGLRHIPKNLQESKATILLGVPLIFEAIYRRIWDQAKKSGQHNKLRIALKASNFLRLLGVDLRRKLFSAIHDSFGGNPRIFISGAAAIDPLVSKGFRDLGIHFLQGYGLTECSPIAALNRDVDFMDNAAGLPLPGLQIKIENPGHEGVGEIAVKGPSVMLGYYENPEATNAVLEDGWFRTGDLGFVNGQGFVVITGRKKNVIVTKNGKNIYPEEIETLLNKSPYIKESLVFGKKSESSDEVDISAIIVHDTEKIQEISNGKLLSAQEIRKLIHGEVKAVNKGLVAYKHIRDFSLRENEFSKTTTKKIKRYLEKTL